MGLMGMARTPSAPAHRCSPGVWRFTGPEAAGTGGAALPCSGGCSDPPIRRSREGGIGAAVDPHGTFCLWSLQWPLTSLCFLCCRVPRLCVIGSLLIASGRVVCRISCIPIFCLAATTVCQFSLQCLTNVFQKLEQCIHNMPCALRLRCSVVDDVLHYNAFHCFASQHETKGCGHCADQIPTRLLLTAALL